MKTTPLAAAAAILLAVPCLADGVADPARVEAAFDAARLADELTGALADPAKEVRVRVYASAGSTASATLGPDPAGGAPVAGLSLTLCDDAGADQEVTGSAFDRTVAGSGVITWRKVPFPATGGYSFILRGTGAGAWRLALSGALAKIGAAFASTEDLGVSAETQVDFHGLAGGTLSFALKPGPRSKFRGELVRIVRPDDSEITDVAAASKGKLPLDADGVHHLVFRNAGSGIGAWTAKTTVAPPKLVRRRGYVRPGGTALVPSVSKVTPSGDFHKDDAAAVTLTGRDFQPGADVRLVREGFQDIIATGVELDSETQVRCTLNLDTAGVTGVTSVGTWNVGVWNAPVYATPADRKTLIKDSPTRHQRKTFECLSAASITLPSGVVAATEVWELAFNAEFQTDLDRMGLGSGDATTERFARETVQGYVLCFLRDLLQQNETTGKLAKNASPAISFVLARVPNPAGRPGEDYNRIEIGGAWQTGDEHDAAEPLFWGSSPPDPGNARRDDLSVEVSDGAGGTIRVGRGVRTRVLDPGAAFAHADWVAATAPLRQNGLTSADRRYFARSFRPSTVGEANRYRDIVHQVTRASREISALVAHHVGRAMGLAAGGAGPMSNPDVAGNLWPTNGSLDFSAADLAALRDAAVAHQLPGKSKDLTVNFFPLLATQPSLLPNSTAAVDYSVNWNFVGGRANARAGDYTVRLQTALDYGGLAASLGGTVTAGFQSLTITNSPVYLNSASGLPYGGIAFLRLTLTDDVRGGSNASLYRLNVMPNFNMLPAAGTVYNRAVMLQSYINNN